MCKFLSKETGLVSIIDGSTTSLLSLAIDAATLRQQALAQNIANANTPGYRRVDVQFEQQLRELGGAVQDGSAREQFGSASLRPYIRMTESGPDEQAVALDTEIAHMAENTLQHQVLIKALGKHLALIGMAINEGKR